MSTGEKTKELQRELLERQLAEHRRREAERVKDIQARCRSETARLEKKYGRAPR